MNLPLAKNQVWSDFFPHKYMVNACEENEVYYLVRNDQDIVWDTMKHMEDCRDVIVFDSFIEAEKFMEGVIKYKKLPSCKIIAIEYNEVMPDFSDDKFWYSVVDNQREAYKGKSKCHKKKK
jgi:hypothetical protein